MSEIEQCLQELGYETVSERTEWRCVLPKGHEGGHRYSGRMKGTWPRPHDLSDAPSPDFHDAVICHRCLTLWPSRGAAVGECKGLRDA